jgi:hypothetical protein
VDKHFTGGVDPFDTLPIPITPQINDLLHFDRIHLSPALGVSKIKVAPSWSYLQDELAVHGYLARIAAIKWRCCEDEASFDIMLKLKAEAMQQLRVNLPQTEPTRLPRAVMALMFTENWCRNLEPALIHVRLLEAIHNHHGLPIEDLINILHADVQRAALTLETTMFAMDEQNWGILEADLAQSPKAEREVDSQVSLQQILAEMQEALAALDLLRTSETLHKTRQAATIRCLHVMGLLLDYYAQSQDNTEKYTALAALYRLRREAKMEAILVCGVSVFHAGKAIIPRLRELLVVARNDPPRLRLWVLSVGAMSGDVWFEQELKRQTHALGIHDSKHLEKVLGSFERRSFSQPIEPASP